MTNDQLKDTILNFLKSSQLTVISTVDMDNNKPECAVVGFAEKENLEIIFGTANTTRKYANIKKNPNVSFVIGWDPRMGTVQYEGVAKELSSEEATPYTEIMFTKNPFSKRFAENPDQRWFLVTPTWIRLTDMTQTPHQISEVKL